MKMFKINGSNLPGWNVISVPTDMQFALGIGNGKDISATIHLYDGDTELSTVINNPVSSGAAIPYYKAYKIQSATEPETRIYRATVEGTGEPPAQREIWIRCRVYESNLADV